MASALFGVAGLQVAEAGAAGGMLEVWAVTDHPAARVCPGCATPARRVHEYVLARPRDVRRGPDRVDLCWVKRRWKCDERGCARKTFTEWVPQVPPRCRITGRLREQAGAEVAGRGSRRPRRPGTRGCRGRSRTRRSPPPRTRCWSSRRPRWRAWASMSTAAAGPVAYR